MSLYDTGIRPLVDDHIQKLSEEKRDYGNYWSASSAGYCMRLQIMRRLGVPKVPELADKDATTQRVFSAGHIFHEWIQRITKDTGLSIAQELELQDESLMVRGHIDDLVLVGEPSGYSVSEEDIEKNPHTVAELDREYIRKEVLKVGRKVNSFASPPKHLILYDYKTQNSMAFTWQKDKPIGDYHRMQLGTYMYMLNNSTKVSVMQGRYIEEARILKISKDDLRLAEVQLLWAPDLEKKVVSYWRTLNGYWKTKTLPKCTCLDHDGGFMGKRSAKGKVYNDFYWQDEPCSLVWYEKCKVENKLKEPANV